MKKNKQVIKNFVSLMFLQGSNYILPLITFPYLVRILEVEKYGLLAIATAVAQYLTVFVDFGFNYTSTRNIAINKSQTNKINSIVSNVYAIKLILTIISFSLLLIMIIFIPSFKQHYTIFLICFINVIGNMLFPIWFYQGMEKMGYITFINISVKILSTIMIFILIKEESDYLFAAFIQSSGILLAGVIGFLVMLMKFSVKLNFNLHYKNILQEIRDGSNVFISTLAGNVYGQGSVIIAGILAGSKYAGYYSIVQKIAGAMVGLAQPLAQALYPYLCKVYINSTKKFQRIKKNIMILGCISALIIGLITFSLANIFIEIITKEESAYLIGMMKLSSAMIIFTICNVLFNPLILAMEKYRDMRRMYLIISFLFVLVSIPSTYFYQGFGIIACMIFVEVFIFSRSLFIISGGILSGK